MAGKKELLRCPMLLRLAVSLAGLHRAIRLGSCSVGRNHCAQLVL